MSPDPIVEAIVRAVQALTERTVVLGLCGAQGSGKSTLAAKLETAFAKRGLKAVALSLDDLYLRRTEREALAREVHPLFLTRGVPGTHDVALGLETLDGLAAKGVTAIPRFDKSRDDRRPVKEWDRVQGPVDVVIFEGWCVGARPQADAELEAPINGLEAERDPEGIWRRRVNAELAGPYRALFGRIDLLVMLQAPGFEVVHRWRAQQEEALRQTVPEGSPGLMSDGALKTFISHYERLTRHILKDMPGYADMVVELDADRRPTIRTA